MKRQSDNTESLVYAYRCREPIYGLPEAKAEIERCRGFWDQLVAIERDYENRCIESAAARIPAAAEAKAVIERESRAIAMLLTERGPDAKAELEKARATRREAFGAMKQALAQWRREYKDEQEKQELARRGAVNAARQATELHWGNYLRVLNAYDGARKAAMKMGRRLRMSDPERDDGCLAAQIQRTRSGLGASAAELQNGSVSQVQIGVVPESAYDPATRGQIAQRRARHSILDMRIDRAGNMLRIPIILHRPLPEDARVKWVQITCRPRSGKMEWQACFTLSRKEPDRGNNSDLSCRVEIAPQMHGRWLRVASVVSPHLPYPEYIDLSPMWVCETEQVRHLTKLIDAAEDGGIPADVTRNRTQRRDGQRARLLRQRREVYRLMAVWLADRYGKITVPDVDWAAAAMADKGERGNSVRHMAAPHLLLAEIKHQARKRGAKLVLEDAPASAPVRRRTRAARKPTALANAAASA